MLYEKPHHTILVKPMKFHMRRKHFESVLDEEICWKKYFLLRSILIYLKHVFKKYCEYFLCMHALLIF